MIVVCNRFSFVGFGVVVQRIWGGVHNFSGVCLGKGRVLMLSVWVL